MQTRPDDMNFKSIFLIPLTQQLRASYDSLTVSNTALTLLIGSNPLQKVNTQGTLWFLAQKVRLPYFRLDEAIALYTNHCPKSLTKRGLTTGHGFTPGRGPARPGS